MLGDRTRGPLRRIGTYHQETDEMEDDRPPEGVMWRTWVTVAVFLGWLVWLLLWWAFWSGDLTIAQRFAVTIVGVLVLGAVLAAVWLPTPGGRTDPQPAEVKGSSGYQGTLPPMMTVFGDLTHFKYGFPVLAPNFRANGTCGIRGN